MRHVDERDADLGLDALQLDLHLLAQLQVERAERLVEEQHLWVVDERSRQRHALLLTTGELRRLAPLVSRQLDQLEQLRDLVADLAVRDPPPPQPEGDILVDRQVREERVALEDGVHVPPEGGQAGDIGLAEMDPAGGGVLEAADHAQRGGLAAAGGAEEREKLPAVDLERQVVHRDNLGELLRHVI